MSLTFELRIAGDRVCVDADGVWELEGIFRMIRSIREETDRLRLALALVDLRPMDGPIPDLERFFAGERVAAVIGSRVRVAVLARAQDINKLGENTAVNRGARMLVTADEAEAKTFLV